jgi:hypothetical protein
MRGRRHRLPAAAAAAAMAAGCLAATGSSAHAGEPVYTARLSPAPTLTAPTSMAVAGSRLLVTDGDAVVVLSTTGAQLVRITGVAGASDATAAPDGSVVAVAATGSDEVVEIDPSTAAVVRRHDVAPCPHELAVTATEIWYTFGCTDGSGGINHITRADGAVHPIDQPDAGAAYQAAHLAAGGGRLVAYDGIVTSWPVAGGSLGTATTNDQDGAADTDLVADDTHVVLVTAAQGGGNGVTVLGPDLVRQRVNTTTGAPFAAALRRDGQKLVLTTSDDLAAVQAVDPSTGAIGTRARMPVGSTNVPSAVDGCVGISADGSIAYALAREFEDGVDRYFVVASAVDTPAPTPVKVTVSGPVTLGAGATITVRTSAYRRVSLTMTTRSGTAKGTFTADGAGVLKVAAQVSFSGTVTAAVEGDLTHTTGSGARAFAVPSVIRTVLSKGYKKRKGITYYRSFSKAIQAAVVLPAIPGRPVSATLFVKRGSHWVRRNTWTMRTGDHGEVASRVYGNLRGRVMQVMFNFRGDDDNDGSTAWTKPFVVK